MPPAPYRTHLHDPDDPEAVEAWTRLRSVSPRTTPFDDLTYARGVAEAFGLRLRLGLATRSDRPAAGVLLYTRTRGRRADVVVPPLTPYTPFLAGSGWHPTEIHRHRSALDCLLETVEAAFRTTAFHLQPGLTDTRAFSWHGWSVRPYYTYVVPLSPDAPPSDRWSKNNRRLFRQQGADAHFVESGEALESVLSLCEASYARHDRAFPAPPAQVRTLTRQLRDAGRLRAFHLTPPGSHTPEAGVLLLQEGERAYYWMAGSVPGPGATLLLGRLLQRLVGENIRAMDFVGANTPSIAEFKRKFGSELVPYYRVRRVSGLLPRLVDLVRPLR